MIVLDFFAGADGDENENDDDDDDGNDDESVNYDSRMNQFYCSL